MTSDDEIPLPCRDQARTRSRPALRKRSHSASHVSARSNSSDGPFFSSDDLEDASADNYASPRRKKQFKRTWWQPESGATSRDYYQAKREAKQPKDSGVFMSDNSSNDDGFSLIPSSPPVGESSRLNAHFSAFTDTQVPGTPGGGSGSFASSSGLASSDAETQALSIVSKAVNSCLEADGDTVDLSSCQLGAIPSGPLLKLQHLIRPPRLNSTPANEDAYHSLAPQIKLYLSSNNLTSYPGAVSSLGNLTVLSLRNNQLSEIPSSIGRLSNLVELNLAGNYLKWLPFELLILIRFGQLSNFTARPNPLVEPFQATDGEEAGAQTELNELLSGLGRELTLSGRRRPNPAHHSPSNDGTGSRRLVVSPIFAGRSAVCTMTIDGRPARGSPAAPSALAQADRCIPIVKEPYRAMRSPDSVSKTPSLFELSLRACAAIAPLEDVADLLPFDTPESVSRSIEQARRTVEVGGRCCSVCGREFLIPRAEWLEYWFCHRNSSHLATDQSPVPFLRQVCSLSCAQPTERVTVETSKSDE